MKRKPKIRRSRDLPSPPGLSETVMELSSPPAIPGRSSVERVDAHKTGSTESVPPTAPENCVAGFIEPDGSDAKGAR